MTEDAGEEKDAPCGGGELGDKRENSVFGVDGVWVGFGRPLWGRRHFVR